VTPRKGKYYIHYHAPGWRVTQEQLVNSHWVLAFIGEYDTWKEACGVVSIELQGESYPYHTEHFLYGRETCS
jgi:hypothetical protein